MGVGHPVMVVEDHDGCHTAGGDHEHDGREVGPWHKNTDEKKQFYIQMIYRHCKDKCTESKYCLHRELKILILKVFWVIKRIRCKAYNMDYN